MVKIYQHSIPSNNCDTLKSEQHNKTDTLLDNSLMSSGQKSRTPSKFVGNINLPITIVDPKTNETLGLIDLEKCTYMDRHSQSVDHLNIESTMGG